MSKIDAPDGVVVTRSLGELTKKLINSSSALKGRLHYCVQSEDSSQIDWEDLKSKYISEKEKTWSESRRREFLLGRFCSESVLRELRIKEGLGASDSDGVPSWPKTTVGSLSHSKGVACAAAAQAEEIDAVGVDLEIMRSETNIEKIVARALGKNEKEILGNQPAKMLCAVSAKEAAYKMIYPAFRKSIVFEDFKIGEDFDATNHFGVFQLKIMRSELIEFTTLVHIDIFYCTTDFVLQTICIKEKAY